MYTYICISIYLPTSAPPQAASEKRSWEFEENTSETSCERDSESENKDLRRSTEVMVVAGGSVSF